jgi:MOSC domain-containing protein YiiM
MRLIMDRPQPASATARNSLGDRRVGVYRLAVAEVLSVNVGRARAIASKGGTTGIDKRPVAGPVAISAPTGSGSGLAGDAICDTASHGGSLQAVYAYAREDLDGWESELGQPLPSGSFGENLTTVGLDVTGARIGELWRVGDEVVLQVTDPRLPCRTFALWLDRKGWVKQFTQRAEPGAYLRVVRPGHVRAGDMITVERLGGHDVTIGLTFRALTLEHDLLPGLLTCPDLTPDTAERARRHRPFHLDD